MLKDLELNRKAHDIKRSYDVMVKASVAALKSLKKLPKEPEKLPDHMELMFMKQLIFYLILRSLKGKVKISGKRFILHRVISLFTLMQI